MSEDTELEDIEVGDGEEGAEADDQDESGEAAEGEESEGDDEESDAVAEKQNTEQKKYYDKKPRPTFEERQKIMSQKTWDMRESQRKLEETAQRAEAAIAKLEAASMAATNPKPQAESFETQEEYIEALTDWKIDQKEAQRNKPQATAKKEEQSEALNDWVLKREKAVVKYTDFEKNEVQIERVARHYKNPNLATLIVESEKSIELVQHLGKNPETLERIAKLSPISLAKEIGRIEEKLIAAKPVFKKQTEGYAPVDRVGTGGGTPTKDPAKMSYAEFAKGRNEKRF